LELESVFFLDFRLFTVSGEEIFSPCQLLESVTFKSGSRLERIHESAFDRTPVDFRLVASSYKKSRPENAYGSPLVP
jgi:hypothetical protein